MDFFFFLLEEMENCPLGTISPARDGNFLSSSFREVKYQCHPIKGKLQSDYHLLNTGVLFQDISESRQGLGKWEGKSGHSCFNSQDTLASTASPSTREETDSRERGSTALSASLNPYPSPKQAAFSLKQPENLCQLNRPA